MNLVNISTPENQKSLHDMQEETMIIYHVEHKSPYSPLFNSPYEVIMISFISSKPTNLLSFTSPPPFTFA